MGGGECALAERRRRGANDNLSHKERKKKRELRGKRVAGKRSKKDGER